MAIMDWREKEQIKKTRTAIVEAWSSRESESRQTAQLVGLCIGHYIPLLIDTAEFWEQESARLRRRLEELQQKIESETAEAS